MALDHNGKRVKEDETIEDILDDFKINFPNPKYKANLLIEDNTLRDALDARAEFLEAYRALGSRIRFSFRARIIHMSALSSIVRKHTHPNYERGLREGHAPLVSSEIKAYRQRYNIY